MTSRLRGRCKIRENVTFSVSDVGSAALAVGIPTPQDETGSCTCKSGQRQARHGAESSAERADRSRNPRARRRRFTSYGRYGAFSLQKAGNPHTSQHHGILVLPKYCNFRNENELNISKRSVRRGPIVRFPRSDSCSTGFESSGSWNHCYQPAKWLTCNHSL